MRGFDSTSYGDAFADVYDEWYGDVTDVAATAARVRELAGSTGSVLELGVGTGRLAFPLAERGLNVTGIDASAAMLTKARTRATEAAGDGGVEVILGDMVEDLPAGPFDVALIAYNTIFNLIDAERQSRCFHEVAGRLTDRGCFVVEAFVPDHEAQPGSAVTVRSMAVDHVVLSVSRHHPAEQRADGQFVEISESGGVKLRPWAVRWSTPEQLDAMAADAGLHVESRTADMAGSPFDDDSKAHVTVYRKS